MADEYAEFAAAREAILHRINKINDDINQNRAKYATTLAARDNAMLSGNEAEAEELKNQCLKLDEQYGWLSRDVQILSNNGARNAPPVLEAGERTIAANKKTMAELQNRWDHIVEQLNGHRDAWYKLTAELGKIAIAGHKIRAQNEDVMTTTGLAGAWVSSPDDRAVNVDKQRGVIFLDPKKTLQIFKRGKHDGGKKHG